MDDPKVGALPDGFTLDQPSPGAGDATLPEGFTVDAPESFVRKVFGKLRGASEAFRQSEISGLEKAKAGLARQIGSSAFSMQQFRPDLYSGPDQQRFQQAAEDTAKAADASALTSAQAGVPGIAGKMIAGTTEAVGGVASMAPLIAAGPVGIPVMAVQSITQSIASTGKKRLGDLTEDDWKKVAEDTGLATAQIAILHRIAKLPTAARVPLGSVTMAGPVAAQGGDLQSIISAAVTGGALSVAGPVEGEAKTPSLLDAIDSLHASAKPPRPAPRSAALPPTVKLTGRPAELAPVTARDIGDYQRLRIANERQGLEAPSDLVTLARDNISAQAEADAAAAARNPATAPLLKKALEITSEPSGKDIAAHARLGAAIPPDMRPPTDLVGELKKQADLEAGFAEIEARRKAATQGQPSRTPWYRGPAEDLQAEAELGRPLQKTLEGPRVPPTPEPPPGFVPDAPPEPPGAPEPPTPEPIPPPPPPVRQTGVNTRSTVRFNPEILRGKSPEEVARIVGEWNTAAQAAADAAHKAQTDGLTGLMARDPFVDSLDDQKHGSQMALDLRGFKDINDTHGEAVGDEVLSSVGQIIKQAVDSHGQGKVEAARVGGDEAHLRAPAGNEKVLRDVKTEIDRLASKIRVTLDDGSTVGLEKGIRGAYTDGKGKAGYDATRQALKAVKDAEGGSARAKGDTPRLGQAGKGRPGPPDRSGGQGPLATPGTDWNESTVTVRRNGVPTTERRSALKNPSEAKALRNELSTAYTTTVAANEVGKAGAWHLLSDPTGSELTHGDTQYEAETVVPNSVSAAQSSALESGLSGKNRRQTVTVGLPEWFPKDFTLSDANELLKKAESGTALTDKQRARYDQMSDGAKTYNDALQRESQQAEAKQQRDLFEKANRLSPEERRMAMDKAGFADDAAVKKAWEQFADHNSNQSEDVFLMKLFCGG